MYLILEGMQLEEDTGFAYGTHLKHGPQNVAEVERYYSAVVVKRSMKDVRRKDGRHLQASKTPNHAQKRATCLLYFYAPLLN